MTRRTRAEIEDSLAEANRRVALLTAELEGAKPASLILRSYSLRRELVFVVDNGVGIGIRDGSPARAFNNGFDAAATGDLRDWLNYHFPKEDA